MRVRIIESLDDLKKTFGLHYNPLILENDLDIIDTECDFFDRKRRDAECICTIAANSSSSCLDLGTSDGRSAFKMATNIREGKVYTVNILPEQYKGDGNAITHLLNSEQIGIFFRERNIGNIEQIYADTMTWQIPETINNLSCVLVDACHDSDFVYSDTKKIFDRVKPGGFILWHDFNPLLRNKYDWINSVMTGVERFLNEFQLDIEIIHLKNSWIGILQKPFNDPRTYVPAANLHQPPMAPVKQNLSNVLPQMRMLRYVIAYPAYSRQRIEEEEAFAGRIRSWGFDVEAYPIPCPGGWFPFSKLDDEWKRKSPALMMCYEALEAKLGNRGVLISAGGSMLHPAFIEKINAYSVFICADDPESSEVLSKPVASAFDYALPTNIACIDNYREWGCKNVDWIFHPINPQILDRSVIEQRILEGNKSIDISLFCERTYGASDRAKRIEILLQHFPQAFVRGQGWPGGYVTQQEMIATCLNSKIGWNLHNSIGPTNTRTTMLPSLGVMQICDNRRHLSQLFALDREVVGFDSIAECIDKTRYYLAHDQERQEIAFNGFRRVINDYTEISWWQKILTLIGPSCIHKFSKYNSPNTSDLITK